MTRKKMFGACIKQKFVLNIGASILSQSLPRAHRIFNSIEKIRWWLAPHKKVVQPHRVASTYFFVVFSVTANELRYSWIMITRLMFSREAFFVSSDGDNFSRVVTMRFHFSRGFVPWLTKVLKHGEKTLKLSLSNWILVWRIKFYFRICTK